MVLSNDLVVPTSLLLYEALHPRKNLSPREKQRYEQLHKGFIGEKKVKELLHSIQLANVIPLFNCLFDVEETEIQIDCILLTGDTIFLLEIKNYVGDYFLENDKIYSVQTKKQIRDPLIQLERADYLFNKLLEQLQVNMKVRSYVAFVNKHFTLYNASLQLPMIFPSQIKRFLQKIDANGSALMKSTEQLAEMLVRVRKEKSEYERLPEYDITQLKRGVFCKECFKKLERKGQQTFSCLHCIQDFHINDLIRHAIAQYHLLFPDKRITTKSITEWCGHVFSRVFVSKFLNKELNRKLNGSHTYYTFKNEREHLILLSQKYKKV